MKRETCHPNRCEPLSCVSFVSLCIDHLGFQQVRLSHELYINYRLLTSNTNKNASLLSGISYPAPADDGLIISMEMHVEDGCGSQ